MRDHEAYVRFYKPDHPLASASGYVYEHRLVLHEAGIELPPGHHVHHINGDSRDNRLENLEVLSASDHRKLHMHAGRVSFNQFGPYKVLTPEQRKARTQEQNRRYHLKRLERVRRGEVAIPHGTVRGYNHYGCRCEPCRKAKRKAVA